MASTTKSPRHLLKDVFGNWHKEDQQRHSAREPLSTEGGATMASTTKSPRLQGIFGTMPLETCTKRNNKDTQQRSPSAQDVGKDGFNNQVSKAFCEGCLEKCAQIGPPTTFNKGALQHRRWGKHGFNNQVSKAFCEGCHLKCAQIGPPTTVNKEP